jgi:CrcB protein
MSASLWLAVGILGGLGAVGRFLVDRAVMRRLGGAFPTGILAVNLSGAFLLGLLIAVTTDADTRLLLGAGLLGAYTTFSTWVHDSHRLAAEGRRGRAVANIAVSLVFGLAAVWLGRTAGSAF